MATLTTQRQGNLWTSSPSADIPDEEHLEARRDELGPTRGDLDEAHGVIELRQLVEHRTPEKVPDDGRAVCAQGDGGDEPVALGKQPHGAVPAEFRCI
mmetsp:Transcript_102790/g.286288  ORF Transcript_102790/g.286288 Transcript_102790/m.286288 type:complete len:98 (+) Transcript_102790:532-825(+)